MMGKTVEKQSNRLPAISETSRSVSFKTKGQENVPGEVVGIGPSLPKILPDINGRSAANPPEYTTAQNGKKSSLRLPAVFESPLAEAKTNYGGDSRLSTDVLLNEEHITEGQRDAGFASEGDHQKQRGTSSGVDDPESSRVQLNELLRRDLIYMHCSQTVSRRAYSYFKRFPSPIPVSRKKEKLMKKMAAGMPQAPPEKKLQPGDLRPKGEYDALWNSVRSAQVKFVRRHKLAHKTDKTHAAKKPKGNRGTSQRNENF